MQTDSVNEEVKYLSSKPMFAIGERIIYAVFSNWPKNSVLSVFDTAFLVDFSDYHLKLLGENTESELFVSSRGLPLCYINCLFMYIGIYIYTPITTAMQ